ncbi:hypothetical protein CEUSTIGMA_g3446.t1 [Chlamydomonas eustigma]|uniref:SNF2 N-terminal domain-containing protein n=1 Tax=Chlamydomonas eustigma TaxID=1157962 RepID=A0A250WYT2_9CHLO|nr:hypothetical protein CEUSTIGMA_g3446.t1 [Chlamydomonas eustigma]|eukprot:GAX76003.1 hypothetical protein CEUSTIGMA_g3446.t1 [Chlamydomonas eustigma]
MLYHVTDHVDLDGIHSNPADAPRTDSLHTDIELNISQEAEYSKESLKCGHTPQSEHVEGLLLAEDAVQAALSSIAYKHAADSSKEHLTVPSTAIKHTLCRTGSSAVLHKTRLSHRHASKVAQISKHKSEHMFAEGGSKNGTEQAFTSPISKTDQYMQPCHQISVNCFAQDSDLLTDGSSCLQSGPSVPQNDANSASFYHEGMVLGAPRGDQNILMHPQNLFDFQNDSMFSGTLCSAVKDLMTSPPVDALLDILIQRKNRASLCQQPTTSAEVCNASAQPDAVNSVPATKDSLEESACMFSPRYAQRIESVSAPLSSVKGHSKVMPVAMIEALGEQLCPVSEEDMSPFTSDKSTVLQDKGVHGLPVVGNESLHKSESHISQATAGVTGFSVHEEWSRILKGSGLGVKTLISLQKRLRSCLGPVLLSSCALCYRYPKGRNAEPCKRTRVTTQAMEISHMLWKRPESFNPSKELKGRLCMNKSIHAHEEDAVNDRIHLRKSVNRQSVTRGILTFHQETAEVARRKREEAGRKRIEALKSCDMESYLAMVKDVKSKRLEDILKQTEECFLSFSSKLGFQTFEAKGLQEKGQKHDSSPSSVAWADLTNKVLAEVPEQPKMLKAGRLREYQMHGLRWLVGLHDLGLNGILADDMVRAVTRPFLIACPSSVLPNWSSELKRWAPDLRVMEYKGSSEAREEVFRAQV